MRFKQREMYLKIRNKVYGLYKTSRSFILNVVEKNSMISFFLAYTVVVIICGIIYTIMSKYSSSNGLSGAGIGADGITFYDGLYFSVVSITTLGFGDLAPIGISRIIVVVQTLFGIIMIGVIISKFTSIRLSHQVKRLFISTTINRIRDEALVFDTISYRILETISWVQDEFVSTPGKKVKKRKSEITLELDTLFQDFKLHSKKMRDFLDEETLYYNFVEDIPPEEYSSLLSSISKALKSLLQLMISYSNTSKTSYLSKNSINNYFLNIEHSRYFLDIISRHTRTSIIKVECARISEICDDLSNFSLVSPDIGIDLNQPDQKLSTIDIPQI